MASHPLADFQQVAGLWRLPEGDSIQERLERMVRTALLQGYFGHSYTRLLSGLQYHLGGTQDTTELATLAALTPKDHVLDVCCFIGGPAILLAEEIGCRVSSIDLCQNCILAATRMAELSGLGERLDFQVADAAHLPFSKGTFSIIWNQCSLEHRQDWLEEFDRVLAPGGRFALTFQFRGRNGKFDPGDPFTRWGLDDLPRLLESMGYLIRHVDDLSQRDIEIGWKALKRKLSEQEQEYLAWLGRVWVARAYEEFDTGIQEMQEGKWGNGRIVAIKPS